MAAGAGGRGGSCWGGGELRLSGVGFGAGRGVLGGRVQRFGAGCAVWRAGRKE